MTLSKPERIRLLNVAEELDEIAQGAFNPVDKEAITELGRLVGGMATDFGGKFPGCLVVLGTIRRSDDAAHASRS